MKKDVVRAICRICVAAMFALSFTGLAEEPPDSIEGKIATFIKEYPPFDVKIARREAEEAFPMNKIGDEVEISTRNSKIIGKFHGLQGDGIKIGSKTILMSNLSEHERMHFDQSLCENARLAYVDNKFTEYTVKKNGLIDRYKNTLIGKAAEGFAKTSPPLLENMTKIGEVPKDNPSPDGIPVPVTVAKTDLPQEEDKAETPKNNTQAAADPSPGAAKPSVRKNKEEGFSGVVSMIPFSPFRLILLFSWFLAGLYALKAGEKKFKKNATLHSYYNLFAIFLGPPALLFCHLTVDSADFVKILFSPKSKKKKNQEQLIMIKDSKGHNVDTSDMHDGLSFLKEMLHNALQKGASDIFIDPKQKSYAIRIRVDGVIKVVGMFTEEQALSVISMIKVAAGMDIAEKRRPQDGSFSANTATYKASFRVASVGVFGGEKIALRVINADIVWHKLNSIGLTKEQYKIISSAIKLPSGMVLMCGPGGSGKTSTLYSMLEAVDYNVKNVISIEEPVEHVMPNISQMEVNVKAGITFASLLRNSLHQNPDIICLGEIRDEETAQLAVHAAQTGHLIIATLHSNDNIGTIDSLMNLGVPLRSIAATLHLIISQRLIRKLCKHCRYKTKLTPEQAVFLEQSGVNTDSIYAARGCSGCDGTGYSGRRALFELLIMEPGLCAVLEAPDASNISVRAYIEEHQNMVNIAGQALELLNDGVTSYEEFERITLNL
jgi:type II secretory ATPase GspE/PulE/Tfp pilus assembly ATPase PilB-like protein